MKFTNSLNLPEAIVNAVTNDEYTRGECDISVTGLLEPPRITVLKEKHAEEIVEDISDRIFILLGKSVHSILEKGAKEGIVEQRFFTTVSGWKIGGQVDLFHKGCISDWKITSAYKMKNGQAPEEYVQQLNLYRYLLGANGHKVDRLEVVAILRDWSKMEAKRSLQGMADYPQSQVVVAPVPLWTELETIEFISKRVKMHQEARKELPECSTHDRWARPDKYALMKKGLKRAVKLYDSESEAKSAAWKEQGLTVEPRPGEQVRCSNYCSVSRFCSQYQKLKQGETS